VQNFLDSYKFFKNKDFDNIKEGIRRLGDSITEIAVTLDDYKNFTYSSSDFKLYIDFFKKEGLLERIGE
jgi:hypothetical protein